MTKLFHEKKKRWYKLKIDHHPNWERRERSIKRRRRRRRNIEVGEGERNKIHIKCTRETHTRGESM